MKASKTQFDQNKKDQPTLQKGAKSKAAANEIEIGWQKALGELNVFLGNLRQSYPQV